jgi:CheY-specific phosphatase CheX
VNQNSNHPKTALSGPEPHELTAVAADALTEVANTMFGMKLNREGQVGAFENGVLECGACISMTSPGCSWNVALFGIEASMQALGRSLLGNEDNVSLPKEELADALGEILNMIAGVVKRKVNRDGATNVQIGLPMFLSGTDCFRYLSKGVRVFCQKMTGSRLKIEVILVWKEISG